MSRIAAPAILFALLLMLAAGWLARADAGDGVPRVQASLWGVVESR